MKKLRNARGKQTKNTASQGIPINQLKPNKHVLANLWKIFQSSKSLSGQKEGSVKLL
jgi:hypothetical protein